MTWWESILRALWLFLPAYMANMAPVFVAKIIPGWKAPIDGGRLGKDGNRILGAGKTWRGLVGGAVFGGAAAVAMAFVAQRWALVAGLDFGFSTLSRLPLPCLTPPPEAAAPECGMQVTALALPLIFLFGAIVGAFALLGDAVKSYFKRRRGKEGGAPWVPFDQLDFVVFGLLGMLLASFLLPTGWVWHALTADWITLTTLLVLTPVLHLLVNRVGYWLGLKRVPW